MAQLVDDAYGGTTLDAQWTTDHANGGTSVVSGGNLTLSITSTAGSRARIRTAPETMADTDTLEITGVSGTNFNCYLILRDDTSSTAFQPCIGLISDSWRAYYYRDSSGGIPQGVNGPTIASRSQARMRRSGVNLVCETFNGTTWDTFHTLQSAVDGLWTPSFTTMRAELMCNDISGIAGPSSFVVAQVGDGAGGGGGSVAAVIRRRYS